MLPIFWFIGCGVLLSLDIMQPSMFSDMAANSTLFIIALAIGFAPVLLATNAIDSLLQKNRTKLRSFYAIMIVFVFMLSEVVYSYTSVKSFFGTQEIPILKTIGILFLPLTFSLYYFVSLFNVHIEAQIDEAPCELVDDIPLIDSPAPQMTELQQLLDERESILSELKLLGADTLIEENKYNA